MDKNYIEKLRQQYMLNPPDGMTKTLVKNMSDNDLLDMHYFLNEDDEDDFNPQTATFIHIVNPSNFDDDEIF